MFDTGVLSSSKSFRFERMKATALCIVAIQISPRTSKVIAGDQQLSEPYANPFPNGGSSTSTKVIDTF